MAQPIDIKKEESRGASEDLPRDNSPRQPDSRGTREAVAARLKQARQSMDLTQKKAAEKASGMSLPSYKDYEAGKTMPGGEAIQGLTKLGINANWLLTGEGPMLLSELLADAIEDLQGYKSLSKILDDVRAGRRTLESSPSQTHAALDPSRLRMAIILTERAAAVQPLTPEQRADMILSFYQHLSK